jgi:IS30 family transposase
MKSRDVHTHVGNTPITVLPSMAADDGVSYQETSHVFKCMQCDLQFQTDIAVVRRNGSHETEEDMIRVRLDPNTALQQVAGSVLSRVVEREVDRVMREGEEEASC